MSNLPIPKYCSCKSCPHKGKALHPDMFKWLVGTKRWTKYCYDCRELRRISTIKSRKKDPTAYLAARKRITPEQRKAREEMSAECRRVRFKINPLEHEKHKETQRKCYHRSKGKKK